MIIEINYPRGLGEQQSGKSGINRRKHILGELSEPKREVGKVDFLELIQHMKGTI